MGGRLIAPWAARLHTVRIRNQTRRQVSLPTLGATGIFHHNQAVRAITDSPPARCDNDV